MMAPTLKRPPALSLQRAAWMSLYWIFLRATGFEGWDGQTLGPYLLVKPDGSEHRARMKETPDGLPLGTIFPWKDALYLLD